MASKSPFTNNIRRFRFDAGEMTQQELANKVGVSRQTIIALEANRYVPSLLLAIRLARVFDEHVEEIFTLGMEGDIPIAGC
ncbi:MAG: helix-turn-helix transcriptional regulator [bacterium]|nr:helix-turn-helix transcriptional regulator [bacterium]